jgi:hypothetical protein
VPTMLKKTATFRIETTTSVYVAALVVLLSFLSLRYNPAIAQSDPGERAAIEIISIQFRDPAQIRQQIASSLDPRGSIGQIDNKLVIASTAANLALLKTMIDQADTRPRRLVVSVDFDHDSDDPLLNADRQQSAQAIEGDELYLIDSEESDEGPASILMLADVREQTVEVSFLLDNIPGFVGRHNVQIPLGVWYVINPAEADETSELPENQPSGPALRSVALRVDVLP